VVIHHIVTEDTIDELILKALHRKEKSQNSLIDAVRVTLKGA
jgi:SNF2 family DNA or RNA helicase